MGFFFGAIEPFIAPFFVRKDVIKEDLIATKPTCQVISHIIKIPLFGFFGSNILIFRNIWIYLCLAVVIETMIGKRMLKGISDNIFTKLFKIILTVLALRIIAVQVIAILDL